jgi:hypothetical protein
MLKLKFQPWQDWHEWAKVYHLLFSDLGIQANVNISSDEREIDLLKQGNKKEGDLKRALCIITMWVMKNVGGDSSKYLKMQKLLIIQTLSLIRAIQSEDQTDLIMSDDQVMALNFRLIHLVELGAKTAEYKKSKQGGKLAMKNVAEELGFPTFLVQLRHQAVHEHGLISLEMMKKAVKRLQGYLFEAYWSPIFNKLRKREQQIHVFRMQMHLFKLNSNPPPLEKMDKEERKTVLMKFTKANLKLNIPLEPY